MRIWDRLMRSMNGLPGDCRILVMVMQIIKQRGTAGKYWSWEKLYYYG